MVVLLLGLFCGVTDAQRKGTRRGRTATGQAAASVRDLEERLKKFRRVEMPFDGASLSARERQMVEKLVEAARFLEDIYWRQNDADGLALYRSLAASRNPLDQMIRRLLIINGSRFDLIEENEPFVGTEPFSPGRGYYPQNLTRDEIERYVKAHPEKREELYSPYTVVIKERSGELKGVPYHVIYREFLEPAARLLREAAALSQDQKFSDFLKARAEALLTDDYYKSDLLWLDLQDPKFDVIFAPYETYMDGVLGVKTSYGGAVLVRNEAESRKLAVFQKYVPEIQEALPLAPEDRPSKRGHLTPMEVMDAPFRVGDLRHGYQAVADNLPNDARIHQEKGSKKIFFKNFMDARVNYVILPLAQRLMEERQAARASAEGYLAVVLMHEIAHELGPAFARRSGTQVGIRESIGPTFSALEEAKADVVGLYGLKWLMDHGALPKERSEEFYASYLAGLFRTIRFGTAEAHGRAEMMQFNYLLEEKAITRDASSGRYKVEYALMPDAIAKLAKELLEIEATGDRMRAENWFSRYDQMSAQLRSALNQASEVPVDIDPVFSFKDVIR
ncbi:MAG TPA: hypothetical protein VF766_05015 [Pyrinomonadaceae bacterium]